MYSTIQLAKKYLAYYITASNGKGHGTHSPFVFDFILHVLNNKKKYLASPEIELLRKRLLVDETTLKMVDLGAGSGINSAPERKVKDLAGTVIKPAKYCQVLFRLVSHYKPERIIEMGTSLGITTSYLADANPCARVITIEGNPGVASVAEQNFRSLQLDNIELKQGSFENLLPDILASFRPRLAYIDGNHRYRPTMEYFNSLVHTAEDGTILVFDDIHWSREMEKAWLEIRNHKDVFLTIDIFFLGFVFFRNEFKVKQNFTIRF